MASIFKKNGKGSYIIAYFDHTGHRREKSSRTTDHATAERIANKLEADVALRREGVVDARADRVAREGRRPIRAHLDDFIAGLLAKGVTAKQTGQLRTRIERVRTASAAETVNDITPHGVQTALGAIREDGSSVQTCNHTLRAVKQLTRWLLRDGRIAVDPILHLKTSNAETDRRYERRALDDDELSRLVGVAEDGPVVLEMPGIDRAMAYRVAVGTGFRLSELKSLTPSSFDLDSDPPTIAVAAAYSKHRRQDTQPIRRDLAEIIRPWLEDMPSREPVLNLPDKAAQMLNADLRRARARWIREVPGKVERRLRRESDFLRTVDHENRVCDFHALRHTYISRLVSSGASVKVCQELARHSTPTLTIGRYAHTRLHDLTGALECLPGLGTPGREVAVLRATGTDNSRPFSSENVQKDPQQNPQQSGRFSQLRGARACDSKGRVPSAARQTQPVAVARVSEEVRNSATPCHTATGRTRTDDLRFMKPPATFCKPGRPRALRTAGHVFRDSTSPRRKHADWAWGLHPPARGAALKPTPRPPVWQSGGGARWEGGIPVRPMTSETPRVPLAGDTSPRLHRGLPPSLKTFTWRTWCQAVRPSDWFRRARYSSLGTI